jgi:hypothetical protein
MMRSRISKYAHAKDFPEGLLPVKLRGKHGYVDVEDVFVICR